MNTGPSPGLQTGSAREVSDGRGAAPTGDSAARPADAMRCRLLDQASLPFGMADFDGRLLHSNRALQEYVGYSAADLDGRRLAELITPQTLASLLAVITHLQASGLATRFETTFRHRDGRELVSEVELDLYRDESDQPLGMALFITDIRERKRTEAALRESAERFQRLYDEAPFGYHELDTEGIIRMVNRTECEMLGYSRAEMLGRPIFDFIHPSQREVARAAVRDRIEGQIPVRQIERIYLTKDGRELSVLIENRLTYDADGRVVGIRSTIQDMTRQKQTEAALIASERRARALFEGIEDAVFVHDLQGRIVDANPAACRRLGYTREEMLTLTTRDVDDPTFAAGFQDRLDQQLRHGRLRIEGRHRTKSGRIIPVDINTSAIQFENQTAVLAVIRDITDRRALEETRRQMAEAQLLSAREIEAKNRQLSQSEARYRKLTEGTLDAIVVSDQGGRITLFNPAAERAYGWNAPRILGQPLGLLIDSDLRGDLMADLNDFLELRTSRFVGKTKEMRGCRKSGESFPIELSLSAIENSGGYQFLAAIRDLTERQRLQATLAQAERLASIGLLSAGVAHEINNPLAYIANNLAVLDRDLKGVLDLMTTYESAHAHLPPAVLERVQAISDDLDWPYVRDNLGRMLTRTREGVQRVANIVQNLRSLARTSPPKPEPALLSDLIDSALDMVQGRVRRHHIEIRVECGTTAKILCVPSQISQVILNILVNAIQAIESLNRPERNLICVITRQEPVSQILEFEDNGCGIPAEQISQLFDPFFTTKPVGEGTGLGLSITHNIITGHGGRIEVESQVGVGTCFRLILPWKPI